MYKETEEIKRLLFLIKELGLEFKIDTSRQGYRIENEFGRMLSPILKSKKNVELALDVMYNAIREYQFLPKEKQND